MNVVMSFSLGPGLSHTRQGMADDGKRSCSSGSLCETVASPPCSVWKAGMQPQVRPGRLTRYLTAR